MLINSEAFFDLMEDAGLDYTDLLEILRHVTSIDPRGLASHLAYYVEQAALEEDND